MRTKRRNQLVAVVGCGTALFVAAYLAYQSAQTYHRAEPSSGAPEPSISMRGAPEPSPCSQIGIINRGDCEVYADVIANLIEGPLAYNRPDTMILDEPVDISLSIGTGSDSDPKADLEGTDGPIVEGTTKIARYMSAELYGSAFQVAPAGPQRKMVVATAPARWAWTVTPNESGERQLLTLDIFVHIQDGDKILEPVTVRTFRDRIVVDVRTWDRIASIAKELEPIHAFAVALIGSLSGFMAWVWHSRRKAPDKHASEAGSNKRRKARRA